MTKGEAVNWLINVSADIGKAEHRALWHYEQALDEIRGMLEEMPDLRWTPCSEKLPEDSGRYLVTFERDGKRAVDWDIYYSSGWLWEPVIAWMQFPEPYEGEVEE